MIRAGGPGRNWYLIRIRVGSDTVESVMKAEVTASCWASSTAVSAASTPAGDTSMASESAASRAMMDDG